MDKDIELKKFCLDKALQTNKWDEKDGLFKQALVLETAKSYYNWLKDDGRLVS